LKELELARLDKWICDLKASSLSDCAAMKLVTNNFLLLDMLRRSRY